MEINHYIFLTNEGFTYQPVIDDTLDDDENRVENTQVLGYASGVSPEDAFNHLLEESPWIKETTFHEVFSVPLSSSFPENITHHLLR